MTIEIRETPIGGDLKEFLNVVDYVYRSDPNFVRPLNMEMKERLSHKNPFFNHAEGTTFTAHRNGWCVGRVTAQIDRAHLKVHQDDAGFFGFLDTVDDQEVADALLDAARTWLRRRGMKRIRGPMSLCVNEELGCLIEGFDTPPMVMMPHHLPHQGRLIANAGFEKIKDLFAWRYTVGDIPKRAQRAHDQIAALPEIKVRHVNMKQLDKDVRIVMDIHNDAWQQNWGFVPLSEDELAKLANDFKLILVPDLTYIVDIDGEPAAFAVATPNLNEVIRDIKGKLSPTGIAKLVWRLKVARPKTARLALLGVRSKYRHVNKYGALSTFLYAKMNEAGARCGIQWGELSYTFEDNAPVNLGIKFMGGKVYKKYRIFEAAL
ncbi:MAG TPA: hypothetical protein VFU02_08270 [Polyangiaceae bacterium]|nr:hypothetical protein [Polyangiaceae bacterium]